MSEAVKEQQQQAEQTETKNEAQQAEQVESTTTEESAATAENTEKQTEDNYVPQSKVDEIVKKRLERERSKFADYDDLKTKLTEYEKAEKERKEAEMSELEKYQAQLDEEAKSKEELTQKIEQYEKQIRDQKVRNEFNAKAQQAGIEYVDAAYKLADLSEIEVGDEGVNGVDSVIESLVENNPFLKKRDKKPIGDATNSGDDRANEKTADQLLSEAADKARKTGKPEDKAAYAKLKRELGR